MTIRPQNPSLASPLRRVHSHGNLQWQESAVTKLERAQQKSQRACCVWLTGPSDAANTSIANLLDETLFGSGRHAFVLDSDRCQKGVCGDLDSSLEGRMENVRRIAEIARLMVDAGLIVIVSIVSPLSVQRSTARELFEPGEFFEIYLDAPLAFCEPGDATGEARQDLIPSFTDKSFAYETPLRPELILDGIGTPDELVTRVLNAIKQPSDEGTHSQTAAQAFP